MVLPFALETLMVAQQGPEGTEFFLPDAFSQWLGPVFAFDLRPGITFGPVVTLRHAAESTWLSSPLPFFLVIRILL